MSFQACNWFSTYRIHHRRAERFRDRRCFLLGDAAHIHSPVGAQGMNTGLQDAYNLGWKLALVISGRAGPALLDSYESERIPVARRLLSTTDRAFSLVVSDSGLAGLFRTRFAPKILALRDAARARSTRSPFARFPRPAFATPNSPLSETLPGLPAGAPRAGDRFPWLRLKLSADGPAEDLFGKIDDTRFTLIVIGQPAPPGGCRGSATCCAPSWFPAIPPTIGSSPARGSPGPRSTCCARTAMSDWPEFAWRPAAVARYVTERI